MDLSASYSLSTLANANEAKGLVTLSQWGAEMHHALASIALENMTASDVMANKQALRAGASAIAFLSACENEFAGMHSHEGFLQSQAHIGMRHMLGAMPKELSGTGCNAFMDYLLNHLGWDPTPLCTALSRVQRFEEKARREQDPVKSITWENNLHYSLLTQLGVATIFTPWQPPKQDVYGGMWYVTPFHECEDPSEAVAAMAAKIPWSFGQALEFYKDENEDDLTASMTRTIFSMNVQEAHPALTAKTLLEMTFDHDHYQSYQEGLSFFEGKHPHLFLALQLQVSLLDHAGEAEGALPSFLPSWEHAVRGTTPLDAQLPLPELGLEGP